VYRVSAKKATPERDMTTVNENTEGQLREVVFGELKAARIRTQMWQVDIDVIGVCLKLGKIDCQRALIRMRDLNIYLTMDGQPGDTVGSL
jgi:hypothetical protein